jgi:hypothetical protein
MSKRIASGTSPDLMQAPVEMGSDDKTVLPCLDNPASLFQNLSHPL